MNNPLQLLEEVRILRQEGKLHQKLISRVRILYIISAVLAAMVIFNLLFRSANPLVVGGLVIIGFILGLFVFSKMNVVNWNEKEEIVQIGKMDKIGYISLGLYIVFEIGLRTFLGNVFPVSATAFLLAGIFGTMFGRAVGTTIKIHKVHVSTHTS